MTNFEIVSSVTENLTERLKALGINFLKGAFEKSEAPASVLPLGQVCYEGEAFEDNYGEGPKYIEARFTIKVKLMERDAGDAAREIQRWTHAIKGALSVGALNSGALADAKPLTRVKTAGSEAAYEKNGSALAIRISVRYRESQGA